MSPTLSRQELEKHSIQEHPTYIPQQNLVKTYLFMDRLPNYVKFTGAFRDLKGRGYRFWKAYASNYRVYTKRFENHEYGQWTNIWQHHGGYLEIDGFMEWTYLLVDTIARNEHKTWIRKDSIFRDKKLTSLTFYVNMKDNTMLVADKNFPYRSLPNYHLMHRPDNISDANLDAMYDEYGDTWREITLKDYIIKEIEDLLKDNLIKIMPDDRKY